MRIGLLGLGRMSQQHLAAFAGMADVEFVTRNAPAYASLDPRDREGLQAAMIADPALNALDICLPTPLHASVAIAALRAGKHVLCEKPLALNNADCSRVLEEAEKSGRVFMVAHVLRFFPAYRFLGEYVKSRLHGELKSVHFARSSGIPNWGGWLAHDDESGGGVLDLLIHDFDQSIALLGMPNAARGEPIDSEQNVDCLLRYPSEEGANEPWVKISGGWFADGRPFSMSFHARFAEADLIFENGLLFLRRAGVPNQDAPDEAVPLPLVDPYAEQLRYFIECCRNNTFPDECPPASSASAVALALAVRSLAYKTPGELIPLLWK